MTAFLGWLVLGFIIPVAFSWKWADPLISGYCRGFAKRHKDKWPSPKLFTCTVWLFDLCCQIGWLFMMMKIGRSAAEALFGVVV